MLDQLKKYFPSISDKQLNQYTILGEQIKLWNQKINLVSRNDINNLFEHHILHSLAIAKVIEFKKDEKVVDIGTGGGFPGLPLAILFPDTQFLLVDSIGKKINAVGEIAKFLQLKNVAVKQTRIEDIDGCFDWAVCRAVGRLDAVWPLVQGKILHTNNNKLPNGLIYLKGGDIEEEKPNGVKLIQWPVQSLFPSVEYFKSKSVLLLYND